MRSRRRPTYPFVECAVHLRRPGYAVCCHIVDDNAPVALHDAPTSHDVGQMVCASTDHPESTIRIVCAECAAKWIPT